MVPFGGCTTILAKQFFVSIALRFFSILFKALCFYILTYVFFPFLYHASPIELNISESYML